VEVWDEGIFVVSGIHFVVLLATVLVAPVAVSAEVDNPWLVRLRGISVVPDESSTISAIGGKATVSNSYVPELDISYFLSDRVAAEIILGVSNHDIGATGTSAGNLGLGSVWLLPPTLNLQYHFAPEGKFRPYLGAGVNLTLFFNVEPGAANSIDYDAAFGFSGQGGADIALNEEWALNLDIKKLFLSTKATIAALGTTVTADVDLHPYIIGVGFARRF
jgi:outer membrane protein